MKIPIQEKIAELERRIVALESQWTVKTTTTTQSIKVVDLEPEMRGIWKSLDALFAKVWKS